MQIESLEGSDNNMFTFLVWVKIGKHVFLFYNIRKLSPIELEKLFVNYFYILEKCYLFSWVLILIPICMRYRVTNNVRVNKGVDFIDTSVENRKGKLLYFI